MTAVPRRLIAVLTRIQLQEMLTATYALARNVDPLEAAQRLDEALRHLRLIEGLQRGTFAGLRAAKPNLDDDALMELVLKKLGKKAKRWQPLKPKAADDAAVAAVILLVDAGAGMASADAWGMMESAEGARFLERGFAVIGAHLARELTR